MKLCRCGRLIKQGDRYCSVCEPKYQQDIAETNKYYDKNIRDMRICIIYNSPEWIRTRKYILESIKV